MVAPRSPSRLRIRSWVIGRCGLMPSISVAIEAASSGPIQIGKLSLLSGSLSTTIGIFVVGSSVRPPTIIRIKSSFGPAIYELLDVTLKRRGRPLRGACADALILDQTAATVNLTDRAKLTPKRFSAARADR